jgi:hypothetical protein
MTDEQINATIAEACGWTDFVVHPEFGLMGMPSDTHGLRTAVDWYTVDLNAMHEAEAMLSNANMYVMEVQLKYVLSTREFYFHATARQRAEAFLRTLGKWKEATDKESLTVGAASTEQSSVDQKEVQK